MDIIIFWNVTLRIFSFFSFENIFHMKYLISAINQTEMMNKNVPIFKNIQQYNNCYINIKSNLFEFRQKFF